MVRAGKMMAALALSMLATGYAAAEATKAVAVKKAAAILVDAENKTMGKATLTEIPGGLLLKASVSGVKPGTYGFHIHTTGKCDKPDFASAGGHWNPTAHTHGKDSPTGQHMGDLPNIVVKPSGMGMLEQKIPGASLTGGDHPLLDADGAAVVLHAAADDYKTDPSGNSGARVACGVIEPAK